MDKKVTQDTWYIAHNESIFHNGFCANGTQLSTGMPIVEEFDNEADYLIRCEELDIILEI